MPNDAAISPQPVRTRAHTRARRAHRLITTALWTGLLTAPLAAQTAVSPSRFELDLDAGPTTESIRVFNYNKKDVEVEVEVVNWDLDESNQVRTLEPTEQSLDQWIVVQPTRFSIPAGQSQTVRFSIRPRLSPTPGEHRGMIYFNQLPTEGEPGFQIVFKVGVAIYGHAGEVIRTLKMHHAEVETGGNDDEEADSSDINRPEGAVVMLDLENLGTANARLSGQWTIWPEDIFPGAKSTGLLEGLDDPEAARPEGLVAGGALPSTPVLPGTRRRLPIELTGTHGLPAGRYVLDLNGTIGDAELGQTLSFSLPLKTERAAEPGEATDDGS